MTRHRRERGWWWWWLAGRVYVQPRKFIQIYRRIKTDMEAGVCLHILVRWEDSWFTGMHAMSFASYQRLWSSLPFFLLLFSFDLLLIFQQWQIDPLWFRRSFVCSLVSLSYQPRSLFVSFFLSVFLSLFFSFQTDEFTCEGSSYCPIGVVSCSAASGASPTAPLCASSSSLSSSSGGAGRRGSSATSPGSLVSSSSSSSFSGHHRAFQHIKENDYGLQWFCRCATLCNEAQLEIPPGTDGTKFTRLGEPTEAALLVLVEKLGCTDDTLNNRFLQCAGRTPQLPMPFWWEEKARKTKRRSWARWKRNC